MTGERIDHAVNHGWPEMINHDVLFGIDGIGDEPDELDIFDDVDELNVQKYLQRALANHVDGKLMFNFIIKIINHC